MVHAGNRKEVIQIGDFAKKAGVSVRAIRYYEELGLIHPESHSVGGFRLYREESIKRIQVIGFLKELGISLLEIQKILLAKKPGAGDRETVQFLLQVFGEKLSRVEAKIEALSKMKRELSNAINILHSCENCDHKVLLDELSCGACPSLNPREAVPDTFQVILG
jgi:DNA-binding transcriptional MerR regulator